MAYTKLLGWLAARGVEVAVIRTCGSLPIVTGVAGTSGVVARVLDFVGKVSSVERRGEAWVTTYELGPGDYVVLLYEVGGRAIGAIVYACEPQ